MPTAVMNAKLSDRSPEKNFVAVKIKETVGKNLKCLKDKVSVSIHIP